MSFSNSRAGSSNLKPASEHALTTAAQEPFGFVVEELTRDDTEDDTGEDTGEEDWEEDDGETVSMAHSIVMPHFVIPDLYTASPPLKDILRTNTSLDQDETVEECLPYLRAQSGEFTTYSKHGIPRLDRVRHIRFLHKTLHDLPSAFVAADAARPWFFYWALCGLRTMGEDVTLYRERLISTVRPMQNESGGFGGGHGQMSHLAPTYAVVLSLAMVGGDAALEVIDRRAMWRWLGNIKQRDGGFQMFLGGEEDVRGTYCAAVIISLLDLPLELPPKSPAMSSQIDTLHAGIPEYVRRCQTYEGGISSRPDGEAHGGYTFCGLACLSIIGDPHVMISKYLDVPALIAWLSSRQYAPEGGFSGRTNKLVDGCYSHWVGGCWPLVTAALNPPAPQTTHKTTSKYKDNYKKNTLFDREGLMRYILCACQDTSRRGGLRDKPSTNSDGYHTCYVLAGLSSAQNSWSHNASLKPTTPTAATHQMSDFLPYAYQWTAEKVQPVHAAVASGRAGEEQQQQQHEQEDVFDEIDRVGTIHPIFVIPEGVAEQTRDYFSQKGGF